MTFILTQPLRDERKDLGWSTDGLSGFRVRDLASDFTIPSVRALLSEELNSIHLFAGFRGRVGRALKLATKLVPAKRIVVFSERPGIYGTLSQKIKRIVSIPIFYRWIALRYRRKIGLVLPLGGIGEGVFRRHGWPIEQIRPFMYCPPNVSKSHLEAIHHVGAGRPVRFLYVGRFTRFTKGTDLLMKAVEELPASGWTLDLYGGYGDLAEEVAVWADQSSNVTAHGPHPASQLSELISQHDVVIVPSRFDGWNVTINEAITAARGVIATDQTVSSEVVRVSGAGTEVRARSSSAIGAAMGDVIRAPERVSIWSERAHSYRSQIDQEQVGSYLAEILEALTFGDHASVPPFPPWRRLPDEVDFP